MINKLLQFLAIQGVIWSQTCNSDEYWDTGTASCESCDYRCDGCDGPNHWDCLACAPGKFNIDGTNVKCLTVCYARHYQVGSTCYNCHDYCDGCSGPGFTNCNACALEKYPVQGTNACVANCSEYAANYYLNGGTCTPCNSLCSSCTGSGSSACIQCSSGNYLVQGTSTCVSSCSSYAANYYTDGDTCKPCNSLCATCSGAESYNCVTCASGVKDYVDSSSKNPKHCVASCPSGTYTDGSNCRDCTQNCEICTNGSASGCTLCNSGYFQLGAACLNACPTQGYYPNSASRLCQPCSDPNCLDCSQADKDTCFSCDTGSRYYLQGSTCSYCPAPDAVSSTECIACSQSGYSITSEGTCEQECGDGIRVENTHECDDGNTDDSDGCNSTCHIESDYICEGGGPTSKDVCSPIVALNILGTSITPDYKLSVSFNKLVKFEKFKLDNLEIKKSEAIDLTVKFEGGFQEISGYKTSFTLEMTLEGTIFQQEEIEIIINTGTELTPSSPYERFPSQQMHTTITLPPSEVVPSEFEATINSVGNVVQGTSLSLIFSLSVSQVAVQSSMESMWVLVNVNQLIALMPLMNIRFPANTIILFKILAFFNGDLIIFKLAYDSSLGKVFTFPDDTPAFNQRFELLGYDSVKLLDNSGVFVVTWVVLSLFVLFAFLLNKACRRSDRINCKRLNSRLVSCVFWGLVLRTLIETFLELGLCSLINLLYISFISPAEAISSIMSLVILLTLLMLPFFVLHILSAPRSKLSKQYYMDKYGQVYKYTYRSESYTRGLFYFLFLMHRYFFVLIVFGAGHSGIAQACLLIIATSFFLYYLIQWRPFSSKVDLALNIFNTIALIILYLFCLLFSIYNQIINISLTTNLGYIFMIIVLALFIVNVIIILISSITLCLQRCNQRRRRKLFPLDQFENPIETHNNTTSPFEESSNQNQKRIDNNRSLILTSASQNRAQKQNRRDLKIFQEETEDINW